MIPQPLLIFPPCPAPSSHPSCPVPLLSHPVQAPHYTPDLSSHNTSTPSYILLPHCHSSLPHPATHTHHTSSSHTCTPPLPHLHSSLTHPATPSVPHTPVQPHLHCILANLTTLSLLHSLGTSRPSHFTAIPFTQPAVPLHTARSSTCIHTFKYFLAAVFLSLWKKMWEDLYFSIIFSCLNLSHKPLFFRSSCIAFSLVKTLQNTGDMALCSDIEKSSGKMTM